MDIGRNIYRAGLSGNIPSPSSSSHISTRKLRDLHPSENSSAFSFRGHPSNAYSQPFKNKSNSNQKYYMHDDSDWDSEPELEVVAVQEASRIQRRMPSIRRKISKAKSISSNSSHAITTSAKRDSPYYCEEIGPQLDLGYQWPQQAKAVKGFVKVTSENTYDRLKHVERKMLVKRQKNKSLIQSLTVHIKEAYSDFNPSFAFDESKIPKRILTKPSKPCRNEGNDNENFDYILKVNEILGHDPNHQYRVIDLLGQGTFGQVVKCEKISTGELFSVKVIKNKSAYKTQSCMEIEILKKLNQQWDPEDKHHILRLHHVFSHKQHLCLVFELLSYNLYDLIGHNRYRGFPPEKVRAFAAQILDTLALLKEAKIIHCDLKPENILLTSEKSMTIKVVDFGSSCHEANRIYTYIQSRFYRSPEVLLGLRYTSAIDMWSFGCIVAELFLGLPLFPGSSEYNQLFRIVEMLGVPPKDMLSKGRNTPSFFNKKMTGPDTFEYELKGREQYSQENNKNELPRKKYFPQTLLKDIIMEFNNGKPVLTKDEQEKRKAYGSFYSSREEEEQKKEYEARLCLLDFLYGVLELNPLKRWTPQQALQHPFITQQPFTGPFKPDAHIPVPSASTSIDVATKAGDKPLNSVRKRSESMNKPTAPEQIKAVAQEIHHPIAKYPKEKASSQDSSQESSPEYRLRHARSQGDYIGLLPPDMSKYNGLQDDMRHVKISSQVKVRTGSHDSLKTPPGNGQTVRGAMDGGKLKLANVRKAHAGEAAGGLLMMRQKENPKKDVSKTRLTDAFRLKAYR
ncbi:dual specificity protein kinase yak1 [Rhizopus azygosporus]|uniref:Dual specificity protein kinase yak1 n=1 Tax=Rhizopus azygosporus TaxID=86630 RepID=A0A367KBD4_RHIAZ|nr:dual specificity protein kinase yak1 [Rhizopus azygosporus]